MTDDLLIPADALPGLLTGWCGPVLWFDTFGRKSLNAGGGGEWIVSAYGSGGLANGASLDRIRLDPQREEVACRLARVLRTIDAKHEVGPLLPRSLGGRVEDVVGVVTCDGCGGSGAHPYSDGGDRCWGCKGSGTLTRIIPAAEVSGALLAASVAGVQRGLGVVRGVRGLWEEVLPGQWGRLAVVGPIDPIIFALEVQNYGRGWRCGKKQGPETGAHGRDAADAAALRLGWAHLDPSAPHGVRVPFALETR